MLAHGSGYLPSPCHAAYGATILGLTTLGRVSSRIRLPNFIGYIIGRFGGGWASGFLRTGCHFVYRWRVVGSSSWVQSVASIQVPLWKRSIIQY